MPRPVRFPMLTVKDDYEPLPAPQAPICSDLSRYGLAYYDRAGQPIDGERWCALFEDRAYQSLKRTRLRGGKWVSTIWLGLNHGWNGRVLIFESMVFGPGRKSLYTQRYETERDAVLGHALLCREWQFNRRQRRNYGRKICQQNSPSAH